MTLNQTPSAERIHIGIFGKRNAGKSSLINALAGQPVSIVQILREPPQIRSKKQWSSFLWGLLF
jgi:ribosome biogenesis GTPase A